MSKIYCYYYVLYTSKDLQESLEAMEKILNRNKIYYHRVMIQKIGSDFEVRIKFNYPAEIEKIYGWRHPSHFNDYKGEVFD